MNVPFPIFRKLSNSKVFYKIISSVEFEEIQLMGSKLNFSFHKAIQYPEKLKIIDLINLEVNFLESSENEWKELKKNIK